MNTVDHLGDVPAHNAVGGAEVVVVTVNLNQAGLLNDAIDVVVITNDTIQNFLHGEDDLTVLTKGVLTLRQITAFMDSIDHLGNATAHNTVGGAEVVVIAVNLDQTGLLDLAVDVVVIANDAVQYLFGFNDHLAVFTEGIGACRQEIVVPGLIDGFFSRNSHVIAADIVVVAVDQNEAGMVADAVDQIINVAVCLQQTGVGQSLHQLAVLGKQVHLPIVFLGIAAQLD